MSTFPILTKADLIEVEKLNRRRRLEEERKKRIFNTKQRLFGLDLDGLSEQLAEKERLRSLDLENERRYVAQTQQQEHMIAAEKQQIENKRHQIHEDLQNYRRYCQRYNQRREFDLNDPNYLKNSKPARSSDYDENLGISSAQIFEGEDLEQKRRKTLQQLQQRAWLDQQIEERNVNEALRKEAEKTQQQTFVSCDNKLQEMANSGRKLRAQISNSILEYNKQLAEEQQQKRLREKQEKHEDDMAEIINMLTSDMLTENPKVANSQLSKFRKIPFMYRGMSAEETQKYRQEQHQQMLADKQRIDDLERKQKQWEQYTLQMDKELKLKEISETQKFQRLLADQRLFNMDLARAQKQHNQINEQLMKKNQIDDKYFAQFNTTSR